MKKIILQHCTSEFQGLIDLSRSFNEEYAKRLGYDYITDDTRRCPERPIWWEKIAYLREMLPQFDDGTLVVWEDADSINLKDISFEGALPEGYVFGMVQNRGGFNFGQLIPWYNAGLMVMVKSSTLIDFFNRVWARNNPTDEAAIVAELQSNAWTIGNAKPIFSMETKWNCWLNNSHMTPDVVVRSFHGIPMDKKLVAMQDFLKTKR